MIVDTSALLAFFHPKESHHRSVYALLREAREPLIVSPYVLAELDYLVATRAGVANELAVLRELLSRAWTLASVSRAQLDEAVDLIDRYADQGIGLADAVNVALANANRTRRIATLDHRHFSVLRLADGAPVEIVP
ncbi:MAG: PIN domain-containing protein [Bifidobacteriaceae bacterium]|nr:PIN domain-containing protein [Bifidobacteriaceae bacterium]